MQQDPDLDPVSSGELQEEGDIITCNEVFKDLTFRSFCMEMRVKSRATLSCMLLEAPTKVRNCLIDNARPKSDETGEISQEIVAACKDTSFEEVCLKRKIPVIFIESCKDYTSGNFFLRSSCIESY